MTETKKRYRLPKVEYLKQLLVYDRETGELRWGAGAFKSNQGKSAWHIDKSGRMLVSIQGIPYPADKIIWFMHRGTQPKTLRHINNIPMDNRIENLEVVLISDDRNPFIRYKSDGSRVRKKGKLTHDLVSEIFRYDKTTGRLFWTTKAPSSKLVGLEAGRESNQHRVVWLLGGWHKVACIIWMYHCGTWPSGTISHKNKDTLDNRIENLAHAKLPKKRRKKRARKKVNILPPSSETSIAPKQKIIIRKKESDNGK
jgi:hypothetical protein